MKPETSDGPFTKKGWVFELKYDGFRILAEKMEDGARLAYRSGRDATPLFPEIATDIQNLPYRSLLVDGEAVILDDSGRPDFQLLQRRAQRSANEAPPVLFVFDLLSFEGYDLRPLPLTVRKSILRRVLPSSDHIRIVDEVPERGEDLFAAVSSLNLEGIVAKREDSPYKPGYSPLWLKIRVDRTGDFIIAGYEPGPGGLRRLHLALCEGADFVYAGTVGSGLDTREMNEIRARLDPARRPTPPVSNPPKDRNAVWVEPELVCEVRYKELTRGGSLRQPVFLRLREDKTIDECRQEPVPALPEPPKSATGPRFTNRDKVFWPDEGYTKGDLIDYYKAVSPWMLPFLKDRPLVLDRYPNGITGKSFFQKNAGESAGPLRTVTIASDSRSIEYFLCENEESLLYLANLGAIPFHVWSSRIGALDHPNWCILDLDPKGAPFRDVARIALALGDLCDEIELPSFIKTSGGSGLHILIPLGGQCDHEQSKQIAELLARVLVDRLPAIATTLRSIPARKGRVYVDALQNGRGKLLAAPYSVRPHPGAPVSTPLNWSEVSAKLDVRRHNLRTVPKRLEKLSEDPLLPVLETRPDLMSALGRLAELI
ncbi:MAG TPA: DNA ligase D [Thermoanaerobaculia bacterium]|nr:DNA ligase D [Thermoanaerobaculia bacterium]